MLPYCRLVRLISLSLACSLVFSLISLDARTTHAQEEGQDEPDQPEPQEIVIEEEFDESDPPAGSATIDPSEGLTATEQPEEAIAVSDLADLETAPNMHLASGSIQRQGQGGINSLLKKILPLDGKSKNQTSPLNNVDLSKLFSEDIAEKMTSVELPTGERISPIDHLLVDVIPQLFDAPPSNENGTAREFKDLAYQDDSNDDAIHLSTVSTDPN